MAKNDNETATAENMETAPNDQEESYDEDMYGGNMPPFMLMKMIFKLKVKVAKLEGMMNVMMHNSGGGSCCMQGGCSCENHSHGCCDMQQSSCGCSGNCSCNH